MHSSEKMTDCTVAVQCRKCHSNEAISEKTPQYFSPMSSAESVAAFSGQTDAPDVRCDLTDRQTHTHRHDDYHNPLVHVLLGLKIFAHM